MNHRLAAAEVAALAAIVISVYAGASLLVAAAGDGAKLSFLSVLDVVLLAYGLSRVLGSFDVGERSRRVWGAATSTVALIVILRLEIAGPSHLFELAWIGDLFLHPDRTLEDQGASITTVALLTGTWLWCVVRGSRALTLERAMTESGAGLITVMVAAAFADAAGAPDALRWLPAPFMAASLLALAFLQARPVERDTNVLFSRSLVWTTGAIAAVAVLASLVSLVPIPSVDVAAGALVAVARAIGIALAWTFSPLFFAIGWLFDLIPTPSADSQPMQPPAQPPLEQPPEEGEPSQWSRALGYVVRAGLVGLVIVVAVVLIWLAFGRLTRKGDGEGDETREPVSAEPGSLLDGLRSMLSRLPLRGSRLRGRDAIGRLYVSMLRAASERGLSRPSSATPLEFAPLLEARFDSTVPGAISRVYAEARYAARPPAPADIQRLRDLWKDVLARS